MTGPVTRSVRRRASAADCAVTSPRDEFINLSIDIFINLSRDVPSLELGISSIFY